MHRRSHRQTIIPDFAAAVTLLLLLPLTGCGQKSSLPPIPPSEFPVPMGYSTYAEWTLPSVIAGDVDVRRGYLYVIEAISADSGRVQAYRPDLKEAVPSGFVKPFLGLNHPKSLTTAFSHDSVFVFVADADTIKRFYQSGGAPLFQFSDSTWKGGIRSIAADVDLNTYVTYGSQIVQYDSRGRRDHVVANNQSTTGLVKDPQGIYCSGEQLLVADAGINAVMRLNTRETNRESAPGIATPPMAAPADVNVGATGEFIYVADTGMNRILKFNYTTGALVDSVYSPTKTTTPLTGGPLIQPRYLASDGLNVYVSDPLAGRIAVFQYTE